MNKTNFLHSPSRFERAAKRLAIFLIIAAAFFAGTLVASAQVQIDLWQKDTNQRFRQALPDMQSVTQFQATSPSGKKLMYKKRATSAVKVRSSRGGKTEKVAPVVFSTDSGFSVMTFQNGQFDALIQEDKNTFKLEDGTITSDTGHVGPTLENDVIDVSRLKKRKAKKTAQRAEAAPIPIPDKYGTSMINKSLTAYCEVDFEATNRWGGKAGAVQKTISLFAINTELYRREGMKLNLDEVFVWETVDPYAAVTNGQQVLINFANDNYTKVKQHIATLLLGRNYGGLAFVNQLNGQGRFNIVGGAGYSFSQLPTYSWLVGALAHEIGHNVASKHTQNCGWVDEFGNKIGRLDSCFAGESVNGFLCSSVTKRNNNGTIMSYCHINGAINLSMGFGKYPRGVMREAVWINTTIPFDAPVQPACTWVAGPWSECINGKRTRTATASPAGCTGANPFALTENCTVVVAPKWSFSKNTYLAGSKPADTVNVTDGKVETRWLTSGAAVVTVTHASPVRYNSIRLASGWWNGKAWTDANLTLTLRVDGALVTLPFTSRNDITIPVDAVGRKWEITTTGKNNISRICELELK